ncbi:sulfate reduction electron transfer complex DsrMKJOP subunit DsrM [Desulfohalovibrio reitneri]|jgi:nitrate reductase gamma subunit|uniref:sulfate reduction electron transfer complex DsrMKJOP subunit DsrM n=1 Tax=Desulfohalovibrio reitneri TaxID=1307759 RepID=UPI0004A739B1|nr:sulfate reduction electron transfer complex DsrMKJOP subunit DsrM [Desulfohalovibrio reitneri]
MNAFYSLFLVCALAVVAMLGVGAAHLEGLFGIVLPYAAVLIFVLGFINKMLDWGRSAVPFRIPTTGGQQKSLDWIPYNRFDNPVNTRDTVIRMAAEVLLFRSLFRNTRVTLGKNPDGEVQVGYWSAKWLWLAALAFHYSFLLIVIRHMRLFAEPIPFFVTGADFLDGILQIGQPTLYMTDVLILAGLVFLLVRRLLVPQMRYLSNAADYFPLFLIIGIALSGVYMRYIAKVDVVAIKEFTMSLVMFSPHIPENIGISFWVHLFLVSVLLMYFPFSKLMHLGGVFLSPTRNLPNDSRIRRHENPWNPKIPPHSYAAYEDDFREPMAEAGLPLEKQPENAE